MLTNGENARFCCKCKQLKSFDDFYISKTGKYGITARCKMCLRSSMLKVPGRKSVRSWDEASVIEELSKWDSIREVQDKAYGADSWIRRNNRLDLYDDLRRSTKWDIESASQEALKYETRTAFAKGSRGAYGWAKNNNVLDIVCDHMKSFICTFEECKEAAAKCKSKKQFKTLYSKQYISARRKGWLDKICKHMVGGAITKSKCALEALRYNTRSEFAIGSARYYRYALKHGILDEICGHMICKKRSGPKCFETCKKAAAECDGRTDFQKKHVWLYNECRRNGWLDAVCSPKIPTGGWGKSTFKKHCDKNNNGKGTLYLIKCTGNGESFYKIGITSRSVKERYYGGRDMPYNYTILWEIQTTCKTVWNIEREIKKATNPIRYQPKLWGKQSLETFKCHGNLAILRKP